MPDERHPSLLPTEDRTRSQEAFDLDETKSQSSTVDRTPPSLGDEVTPPKIDGYAITVELARGGMGVVYAATDLTLKREVAIKTLLPGREASRFVTESEIAARLPHPGIPPVHSLGRLDDGSPYLVMKLIRGRTLSQLLKDRSSPADDLSKFIAIFEQIAQAVGFAHEQGIIHRDLKPLNVMVGAFGEVQVMDWGLAKDLTASRERERPEPSDNHDADLVLTSAGQVMGTPGYMSPEQARGEPADARTDVFSLGAILAAILTGKPAFVGTTARETIEKSARGDLAETLERLAASPADSELTSLAKHCLAADAAQRPSDGRQVAQFVADYRLGVEQRLKQAETAKAEAIVREAEQKKRRRTMQWAAGIITAVLLAGVVGTSLAWNRSETNLAQAKTNLAFAKKGNEILGSVFVALEPKKIAESGRPLQDVLRENLGQAVKELDGASIGDSLEVAAMQQTLGASLLGLGEPELAIKILEKTLATRKSAIGEDDQQTLTTINSLAKGYEDVGRFDEALSLYIALSKTWEAKEGSQSESTLSAKNNQALCFLNLKRAMEALTLLHQVYDTRLSALGPDHISTIETMQNLAMACQAAGNIDQAIKLLEAALARVKGTLGVKHPTTITFMNNLGRAYAAKERTDGARPLFEQALALARTHLGPDHPTTLVCLHNVAFNYMQSRRFAEALPLFEEAFKISRIKHGSSHPKTMTFMRNLVKLHVDNGRWGQALPLLDEKLAIERAKFGQGDPATFETLNALAEGYRSSGRLKEAIPCLQQLLEYRTASLGPKHDDSLYSVGSLARAYLVDGTPERALPLIEQYIAVLRGLSDTTPPKLANSLQAISTDLSRAGQFAVAEGYLKESLSIRQELQPDAWSTFNTQSLLGGALLGQKKYAEAEPLLLKGYEGLKARGKSIPPQGATRIPEAIDRLIELFTATKKPDEAKKWKAERAKYPDEKKAPPAPVKNPPMK